MNSNVAQLMRLNAGNVSEFDCGLLYRWTTAWGSKIRFMIRMACLSILKPYDTLLDAQKMEFGKILAISIKACLPKIRQRFGYFVRVNLGMFWCCIVVYRALRIAFRHIV